MKNYLPIFNEKSLKFAEHLKKRNEKEFDIFYPVAAITLEIILKAMELDENIMELDEAERDEPMKNLEWQHEIIAQRFIKIFLHPEFIFNQTSYGKDYKKFKSKGSYRFAEKVLENLRTKKEKNVLRNFVRNLIDEKYNFSDSEILDEFRTLIGAAQTTTPAAVSSALLLLAMNKEVQDKVYNELISVMKSPDEQFTIESIRSLKYLEMVIKESLRILPVVPFFTRQSTVDMNLDGFLVPKETPLLIPVIKLHKNPKFWGDDAHLFKPERFEEENIKKVPSYAYIPFAGGHRMCIGWRYAMNLTKIILAHFIMHFEVDTKLKMDELKFKFAITMSIAQGYMISIKERNF